MWIKAGIQQEATEKMGFNIPKSLDWFVGENLNRKPWFLPSNIGLSCIFSHHPIL
jgi:hypothetical protein